MAVAGLAAHQHCEICGKVVGVGERWCSSECETKHAEAQRYKKRQMWILLALIVGILIVFRWGPLLGL